MKNTENMATVLVTGGTGFVGSHCIERLLTNGYTVRTTVRTLKNQSKVVAMLNANGTDTTNLSFFDADLVNDAGWQQAVNGCDYVLHVASPFPSGVPKDENELIIPAREGTLRVLRAAREGGVKRVVMTSSSVAITDGKRPQTVPFTEKNWTSLDDRFVGAYAKSKTLAEQAAWDFISREGGSLELSVINPVGIFGPALSTDVSASVGIIKQMLNGDMPALPNIRFGVLDVRDLADLHVRAMTSPAAKGERFIAVSDGDFTSFQQVAKLLKNNYGTTAKRVSTRTIPDWMLRLIAVFSSTIRLAASELGNVKYLTNSKAKRLLGWHPRPQEETLIETADSLLRLQLIKS
ncbi:SDR family oxidoreductase [Spirosoma arcticum]